MKLGVKTVPFLPYFFSLIGRKISNNLKNVGNFFFFIFKNF